MSLSDLSRRLRDGARTSSRRRRERNVTMGGRLQLEVLESRLVMAASTWSGAVSNLWSVAGNWNAAPVAGNDLIFPTSPTNTTSNNDLTAGTGYANLTVSGGAYAIGGNAIGLTGQISAPYSSSTSTVNLPIALGNPLVTVSQQTGTLTLGGILSGTAGLTKQGPGVLDLAAANTYTGTTTVGQGTLLVDGSQPTNAVAVSTGTTLGGVGTVGSITSTGGIIKPGDSGPGVLTDTGNLTLDSASTFVVSINGAAAGVGGYSQLAVGGTISLSGATLTSALGSFTPTAGQKFTLIQNTGTTAIAGNFAGLPEGATINIGTSPSVPFRISYAGGTGHDVVLTALAGSTISLNAAPTATVFGQQVTLTATVAAATSGTGTPTGSVTFSNSTTVLGTIPLGAGGVAVLTTQSLPVGTDSVTAKYLGDNNFNSVTSSASTITVSKGTTTTTLTAAPNPSTFGQSVTLTATVAPVAPAATTPTGTVTFNNGTTSLGTGTLNNGVATLTTSTLAIGTSQLSASYGGDTNSSTSSSSPALTQTVNQGGPVVTVTSSNNSPVAGEAVTLTATLTASGGTAPTGTVEFLVNGVSAGTGTIASGKATLIYSKLTLGTDTLTATYQGDTNFAASTSPALTITSGTPPEQFINQIYLDVLKRPAVVTELDYWRSQLIIGRSVNSIVRGITNSGEAVGSSVQTIYQNFLGRAATTAEVATAVQAPNSSYATVEAGVLGSEEYFTAKANSKNKDWVTNVYTALIGVAPTTATLDALTSDLNRGASRYSVALSLDNSQKGRAQLIDGLFTSLLDRPAGTADLKFYVGLLNRGVRQRQIVIDLLSSHEFIAKYPGV